MSVIITGIYKITSPIGRVYIGSSANVQRRFKKYKTLSCKRQLKLYRSLVKYGVENHIFEVIYECSADELFKYESFFGDKFNVLEDGLNCFLPKTNDRKVFISEETRNRISKSQLNRIVSEEARKKISEYQKGKIVSKVTKEKISLYQKGRVRKPFSAEAKLKMSLAKKGIPLTEEHKEKIRQSALNRTIKNIN